MEDRYLVEFTLVADKTDSADSVNKVDYNSTSRDKQGSEFSHTQQVANS